MSLKGSAREQGSAKDEIHQLGNELQLTMEETEASMIHAMREI